MPQLDFVNFFSQIIWLIFFFSFFYIVSFKSVVPFLSNILKIRAKSKKKILSAQKALIDESAGMSVSYDESITNSSVQSKKFVLEIGDSVSSWEKASLTPVNYANSNVLYIESLRQILLSYKGAKRYL